MNHETKFEDVTAVVRSQRGALQRLGVTRLRVFGSLVRGALTPDSDLDFLVDFDRKTFDRYMDLKFLLEDSLGRRIDLVVPEALKPALREGILREARDVPGL